MKRSLFLIFPILSLCACVNSVYYPYEGNKTITGEGGFQESYISAAQISRSIFNKKNEYKYDGVMFYMSGLPKGKKCELIGYLADQDMMSIAKKILELNGNTATKSNISLPIKFDNNAGIIDGNSNANDWYNGYGEKVAKGYNIFECK